MKSAFFLMAVLLIGCGDNSGENSNNERLTINKILVHGNPRTILSGTSTNDELPSLDTIKTLFNESRLIGINGFISETELSKADLSPDLEDGNEAQNKDQTKESAPNYQVLEFPHEILITPLTKVKEESIVKFVFQRHQTDEGMTAVFNNLRYEVDGKDVDIPAELVHFSLKNDGTSASFLVFFQQQETQYLINYVFGLGQRNLIDILNTSEYYLYLFGPGVRVRWPQKDNIALNFCSRPTPQEVFFQKSTKKSIETWNRETNVTISYDDQKLSYPPFSDLNSHCVYLVRNYRQTLDSQSTANPAGTLVTPQFSRKAIIDSDIFIWANEVQKLYGPVYEYLFTNKLTLKKFNDFMEEKIQRTMTHEIGHFLGLDHMFNGTRSIMSYNPDDRGLSSYDKDAISELYKDLTP